MIKKKKNRCKEPRKELRKEPRKLWRRTCGIFVAALPRVTAVHKLFLLDFSTAADLKYVG